jgi:hypothetical protein
MAAKKPTSKPAAKPAKKQQLTPKERLFVAEYLKDKNAAAAYLRAGYKASTRNSAKSSAHKLMQKAHIKVAVLHALDAQEQRTLITADENLRSIQRLAEKAEVEAEYTAAIRGRELIGKHYRSFGERIEHSGPGGVPLPPTAIVPIFNVTLTTDDEEE